MTRDEILKRLERAGDPAGMIAWFDIIRDNASNMYFSRSERLGMLTRLKSDHSSRKPNSQGEYSRTLLRLRKRFFYSQQSHDLILAYINELIDNLKPHSNKPTILFREAIILNNKDGFIEAIRPHLTRPKSYAHLYFALQEAGVIAEMDKNEAHLIFTAEFGDIGSKQNFSSHLKDFNDLRRLPQGANDDERVKIDRFMNIINRFI